MDPTVQPPPDPGSDTEPLLRVRDVSFAYGRQQVLSEVSFDVRPGEVVGIIGPNGSGKSTLLSLLMNLHSPSRGTVEFRAERVDTLSTPVLARRGVAKTFQHPRVFRTMTVWENMMVGFRGDRAARHAAHADVETLLDRVELSRMRLAPGGTLSVGQQKLLDLARALVMHPKLLLLDEVTAGVHPTLIPKILGLTAQCVEDGGAIILVTHELDVARTNCSRLLGLHNGRIIADGKPEDVLGHDSVVEAYLGV